MESNSVDVLQEFPSAEHGPGLYGLLFDLIGKRTPGAGSVRQEIELNVCDLEIDHAAGTVSI